MLPEDLTFEKLLSGPGELYVYHKSELLRLDKALILETIPKVSTNQASTTYVRDGFRSILAETLEAHDKSYEKDDFFRLKRGKKSNAKIALVLATIKSLFPDQSPNIQRVLEEHLKDYPLPIVEDFSKEILESLFDLFWVDDDQIDLTHKLFQQESIRLATIEEQTEIMTNYLLQDQFDSLIFEIAELRDEKNSPRQKFSRLQELLRTSLDSIESFNSKTSK